MDGSQCSEKSKHGTSVRRERKTAQGPEGHVQSPVVAPRDARESARLASRGEGRCGPRWAPKGKQASETEVEAKQKGQEADKCWKGRGKGGMEAGRQRM